MSPPRHAGGALIWPDWSGHVVAIVASGPSAKAANLEILKGRAKVLVIKETVDLAPWADAVYGCDGAWWAHRRGLPEFNGLKVCWDGNGARFDGLLRVRIAESGKGGRDRYSDDLSLQTGIVGGGGNSGFQALNLAVQWGARRVLLVGFDMQGSHWYGRNRWPLSSNPTDDNFRRWIAAFGRAAPLLKSMGAEVVNTSPASALKCFPFATLEASLAS